MKTKFSKRILSLFLAVMMVVTSIPMFALTASAAGTTLSAADQSLINSNEYLMTYFKDDTTEGQQVYMAVSNDGANWTPLNSNSPVLTAPTDKGAGAARDPYLYKGPDGTYYIVATSMDASLNSWWNYDGKGMYVWSSTDLINWSEPTFTDLSGEGLNGNKNNCWFGRIWAPQIVWDDSVDKYMIYLGLATEQDINGANPGLNTDMVRFYCTDPMDPSTYDWSDGSFEMMFETNPKADNISRTGKTGADSLHSRIDGDIYYDVATDKYYLYYSDYGDNGTMGTDYTKKTYYAVSDTLAGPYKGTVDPEYCLYDNSQMEGFTTYTLNDGTVMAFGDYNTGDSVSALFKMNSVTSISETTSNINNIDGAGNRARHGSVIDTNPATTNDLLNAISAYETKMENTVLKDKSTVYKNLQPAYNAYVAARKAYDAYYYGGNTGVDIDAYTKQLIAATNAMTAWTQYTANNPRPSFDQGTVPDEAYANLLYSVKINDYSALSVESSKWSGSCTTTNQIGYNATVMMYDGKTVPKMPVLELTQFYRNCVDNPEFVTYGAFPLASASDINSDHKELELIDYWYSNKGTGWNFQNEWGQTSGGRIGYKSTNYGTGAYFKTTRWNSTSWCANANVLKFNTDTAWSDGEYYKAYTNLAWGFYYEWNGKTSVSQLLSQTGVVNDNSPIYVINYKALTDAINTAFDKLPANINSYKQGGLSSILGAIDNATGYDPNSSFFGVSSAYAGVTNFNKKVSALIDKLNLSASKDVDEDKYQALREEMDKHITNSTYPSKETYTSDSVDKYITDIYPAAQSVMRDVLENGYTKGTNAGLDDIALEKVLNPIMDKSALQAEIANKDNPVIFDESGNQTKTYASWLTVNTALTEAKQVDETITAQYQTGNAFYADANSTDLPYSIITTDNTQAVTDATTNLQNANLVDIDTVGYPSFDAAKTVVDSIDRAKYTTSALEAFDRAVSDAKDLVYYTPTADEISAYNDNTEGTDITGDLKISTSLTNTDAATIALLNAVNTLNTVNEDGTQPNVNKYSAKIYDSDKNYKETISKYYGDTFKYNVGETLEDGDVVTWVVTVYANDTDLEKATADEPDPTVKPIRSQVVSNYNGITIERTANGSMCIQYIIDKGTAVDQLTYKIYNAYGNVIDVLYGSEGAYDDAYFRANYPDPVLPFYTFKEWSVSVADNGVVKVKPVFDETPTKTVTVDTNYATISFNKMSGGKAIVGATATITGNSENIYGWAVATGGKYQIVGYGKDYKFNVFADERYIPIIKTESGYQINGTDLTADMVAGFSNNSNGNLSDNAYLAAKLDAKAPFVYYQTKSDFYDKGVSKTKVYVRITAGSGIDNLAYGLQINGNKFVSTAKNEGGQFYMTMKTASYNGVTENNMSAYVSYTFPYTFKDETAYITTIDYAKIK